MEHIPVLTTTLAELISIPTDGVIVDATVGHGGHTKLFGSRLGPEGVVIGLDLDDNCIQRAHHNLSDLKCKVVLVRSNFANIAEVVQKQGFSQVDFILADLGVCSAQLVDVEKGLSFGINMPLDMRLDNTSKVTAADIVNKYDEKDIADLIYEYGQDRASRRIAKFIVEQRKYSPIMTTGQLSSLIGRAVGFDKKSRIHPATKTFQALRIAVNDELGSLKKLLSSAKDLLKKDGKIAVISFHSLEDGIVKENFRENGKNGIYRIITKKPIIPSDEEIEKNIRSRSSKLRIAQKM